MTIDTNNPIVVKGYLIGRYCAIKKEHQKVYDSGDPRRLDFLGGKLAELEHVLSLYFDNVDEVVEAVRAREKQDEPASTV